jgi:hypothetical protein
MRWKREAHQSLLSSVQSECVWSTGLLQCLCIQLTKCLITADRRGVVVSTGYL